VAGDSDVLVPEVHEDALPGSEAKMQPKPDWEPRYPGSGRLKDKVAIVTGGDSGIGRAVAALFAREGADVAIVYLCEDQDAEKSKQIVEAEGRRAITIRGDVGSKDFCEEAVSKTIGAFGKLDVLVNNAGEQHEDKEITEVSEQQLRRTCPTTF
jgi:NAD(P)-dependent dehydrogenase (short-subunit alcohol dehydrogenase family)